MPTEYYTVEKEVKLTQAEIDLIIEQLNRAEHGVFDFLNYQSVINKLKGEKSYKCSNCKKEFEGKPNFECSCLFNTGFCSNECYVTWHDKHRRELEIKFVKDNK